MSIEINSMAVLNIYAVDYCCIAEIPNAISVSEYINSFKKFRFQLEKQIITIFDFFVMIMYKKRMKKLKCSVILKLKNVNFTVTKNLFS